MCVCVCVCVCVCARAKGCNENKILPVSHNRFYIQSMKFIGKYSSNYGTEIVYTSL